MNYGLGLQLPTDPPMLQFASPDITVWTMEQIVANIKFRSENKISARATFDDSWILNQEQKGSCCPCSATALYRKGNYLRGVTTPKLEFGWLYSQVNQGSDSGAQLLDIMHTFMTVGCPAAKGLPDANRIFSNQWDESYTAEAAKHKATFSVGINSELALATRILSVGPCQVAVHVGNNYTTMDRQGIAGSANGVGNHAVHADDVILGDNDELLFRIPGSWGTKVFDAGISYHTWKRHFAQTHTVHQFWAYSSSAE